MLGILNPLVTWLALAALVAASYGAAYWKGRQDGWDKREEVAAREAREAQRLYERLAAIRQKITRQVSESHKKKVEVIYKDREVVREIKVPDRCELSSEWVRLHNTAAGLPDATAGVDGTAEAAAAAEVVAGNYLACREYSQRLNSLQEWIKKQHDHNLR